MRKILFYILTLYSFTQCDKSEIERNPYLYETNFSITINTKLPKYIRLQSPPNAIYIGTGGAGIKGIYLVSMSKGNYLAWEAACPNKSPSMDCSKLELEKGLTVKCPCNGNVYSLANGAILKSQGKEKQYPLLNYRVSVSGDIITIFN